MTINEPGGHIHSLDSAWICRSCGTWWELDERFTKCPLCGFAGIIIVPREELPI